MQVRLIRVDLPEAATLSQPFSRASGWKKPCSYSLISNATSVREAGTRQRQVLDRGKTVVEAL